MMTILQGIKATEEAQESMIAEMKKQGVQRSAAATVFETDPTSAAFKPKIAPTKTATAPASIDVKKFTPAELEPIILSKSAVSARHCFVKKLGTASIYPFSHLLA